MISAVFGDETINVSPSGLSTQPPGAGKGSLVEFVSSSLTSTWARAGTAERANNRGAITAGRMNWVLEDKGKRGGMTARSFLQSHTLRTLSYSHCVLQSIAEQESIAPTERREQ